MSALPADYAVSNGVGVLFVAVAGGTHAAFELHACALLHDVGGLVRRGVKIRLSGERDAVARGIRAGANGLTGVGCRTTDMGVDATDIVGAERGLDPLQMWQWLAGVGDARGGGRVDVRCRTGSSRLSGFALDWVVIRPEHAGPVREHGLDHTGCPRVRVVRPALDGGPGQTDVAPVGR